MRRKPFREALSKYFEHQNTAQSVRALGRQGLDARTNASQQSTRCVILRKQSKAEIARCGCRKNKMAILKTERVIAAATLIVPSVGAGSAGHLGWHSGMLGKIDAVLFCSMYGDVYRANGRLSPLAHPQQLSMSTPTSSAALAIFRLDGGRGPVIFWVTIHRRHHQFSDREGDSALPSRMRQGAIWHPTGFRSRACGLDADRMSPRTT